MCWGVHTHVHLCRVFRGQLNRISSLLPPETESGSNLGHQTWQQALYQLRPLVGCQVSASNSFAELWNTCQDLLVLVSCLTSLINCISQEQWGIYRSCWLLLSSSSNSREVCWQNLTLDLPLVVDLQWGLPQLCAALVLTSSSLSD